MSPRDRALMKLHGVLDDAGIPREGQATHMEWWYPVNPHEFAKWHDTPPPLALVDAYDAKGERIESRYIVDDPRTLTLSERVRLLEES